MQVPSNGRDRVKAIERVRVILPIRLFSGIQKIISYSPVSKPAGPGRVKHAAAADVAYNAPKAVLERARELMKDDTVALSAREGAGARWGRMS